MRTKLGYLTIVLMLMGGLLGGCPPVDEAPLDNTDQTNTNNNNSGDNNNNDSNSSNNNDNNSGDNNDNGNNSGNNDNGNNNSGNNDNNNDDDGNNNSNTPAETLTGTFAAAVTYTKTESIGGPLGMEKSWSEQFSFEIDDNGIPVEYTIPGYMQTTGGIKFIAQVHQVGETATLTETSGPYTATLKVTVALAEYNDDGGRVVLELEHNGAKGSLTEAGTGMCVIEFEADGDNVTYSSETDYNILLSGLVNTRWHVEVTGTLTPQ